VLLCALLGAPALLSPAAKASTLSASNGRLSAFPSRGAYGGTLGTVRGGDAGDRWAFAARVTPGSGYEYARGRFNVSWPAGSSVTYSGAFLLPVGFATARSGQVALMRLDNYGAASSWEQDSLNVNLANHTAALVHETVTGGRAATRTLTGGFRIPLGRWFTVKVTQTLGSGAGARNSVYLNGQRVGYSTTPNLVHRSATAVRYGIVATFDGAQHGRTWLAFDRVTASATPPTPAAPAPPPAVSAASAYVSPLTTPYTVSRTDMGVDLCLPIGAPIDAVGSGVVLGVAKDWYTDPATGKAEPYVWYRLLRGPDAGQVVYVAEQINLLVTVGEALKPRQEIGTYAKSGTCIEMGWGDPKGTEATDAQVTTGYQEGEITKAGVSFAKFLISLGLTGPFELTPN
jgi:murein DD-endopeptidase MepM/ murein hydrolase activator NlpD